MTAPDTPRYVGVGAARGVPEDEVLSLVRAALAEAGGTVAALATVGAKAAEAGLTGAARRLGVALLAFPAGELAGVRVPGGGSAAALAAVGTPSVAEAAALLAAGPGAQLLVGKRKSAPPAGPSRATCAVAAAPGHHRAGPHRPSVIVVPSSPGPAPPAYGPQGELVTTPPALLISGHGDRDDDGAQALRTLLDAVAERCPEVPAAAGFPGRAPSALPLAEAVDALAARGATEVVTVPLLPEGPVRRGPAAELTAAAARHAGLSFVQGQAPDGHPALLGAWERRLDEALGGGARRPRDRARTTVLLVGAGSGDPYANAEVARAARLLWEGRGLAGVETAFLSYAAPDVPAGLERCRVLGAAVPGPDAPGRIVVLPCFPLSGAEQERLRLQTEGWGAAHPESEVTCAEPVGAVAEVADAVAARYREAVRSEAEHRVAVG
ncbi:cobalamin biosynthesis protein [Streptomyces sp. NPDC002067]